MRQKHAVRVVNLKTFQGTEEKIECFGFTEKGIPIVNPRIRIKPHLRFTGGYASGIALAPLLVKGHKLSDLLRERLDIDEKQAEALVKPYAKIGKIFFYRKSDLYANAPRGDYEDEWVCDTDRPKELDFTMWNAWLKKVGSDWRIYTPRVARLLRKLDFERIMG